MNTKAMYNLTYGLFVLTARVGDKDNGCIINTAGQVTTTPNRISIAVNKANHTHDMILESGIFNVSILSEKATFDIFTHFGFSSGRDTDKFSDFSDCKRVENGAMVVTRGTNAYISARVEQTVDLGTHTLFIAEVTDMDVLDSAPSATYAYYHSNIKPAPNKPVESDKPKKVAWQCRICGYIYEGEELPEDFVCPLCLHPASDFERIEL